MKIFSKDKAIMVATITYSLWLGGLAVAGAQDNPYPAIYDGLTPSQSTPTNYVETSPTPASGGSTNPSSPASGGSTNPSSPASGGSTNPSSPASDSSGGNFYLQNPLSSQFTTVGGLVEGFMQIFSYIAVLFAVLMLIYVGLQFVLARGKPERLNELKMWLLYIVIGVAIVIGARIIVEVVINTLQATGTVSPGVINNAHNALNP